MKVEQSTRPVITLVVEGEEASLLLEAMNKSSTTFNSGLGDFCTRIYDELKRLGVKLPVGHPSRGRE